MFYGPIFDDSIKSSSSISISVSSSGLVTATSGSTTKTYQIPTTTQATPSISVNSSGLITATSTQNDGYVAYGTTSSTKQLTTKSAATYTPGTSNQTIASGTYLTGVQTILGDSDLKASNILSGVSIFGVTGTASSYTPFSASSKTKTVSFSAPSSWSKLVVVTLEPDTLVDLFNDDNLQYMFIEMFVKDSSGTVILDYVVFSDDVSLASGDYHMINAASQIVRLTYTSTTCTISQSLNTYFYGSYAAIFV